MVKALTCKVTGVDLGSDGWPNEQEKYEEVPAGIYLAQSNMIVEGQISVYAAGEFDGEEEEDDDAVKVNDIVSKFQLMQCEGLTTALRPDITRPTICYGMQRLTSVGLRW